MWWLYILASMLVGHREKKSSYTFFLNNNVSLVQIMSVWIGECIVSMNSWEITFLLTLCCDSDNFCSNGFCGAFRDFIIQSFYWWDKFINYLLGTSVHILLESYKEFIFSLPFVGCTNDIEWLLCSGTLIAKTGGPCGSFLSLHPMAF